MNMIQLKYVPLGRFTAREKGLRWRRGKGDEREKMSVMLFQKLLIIIWSNKKTEKYGHLHNYVFVFNLQSENDNEKEEKELQQYMQTAIKPDFSMFNLKHQHRFEGLIGC
jgi:hypothetical protein